MSSPTGSSGPPGSPQPGSPQPGSYPPGQFPPSGANPFSDSMPAPGYPPGYPYPPPGYPPPPTGVDPALRMVVPIGVTPWAILSGYLGLLAFLGGLTGPFAVLTGILALRAIRKNPQLGGSVRAWVGIFLGTFGVLLLLLILVAFLAA